MTDTNACTSPQGRRTPHQPRRTPRRACRLSASILFLRRWGWAAMAAAALLGVAPAVAATQPATPTPVATQVPTIWTGDKPPFGFTGGTDSIDALIDQFLAAVKAGDAEGMDRLRVTKQEYANIIVPGEVPKGQPPRQTFESVNNVFFGMMDTRSRYTAQAIIDEFKGKEFVRRKLELSKGKREFAWFTGYGEVRLTLTDPQGKDWSLRTGWIAEVDGRYKFVAFNRHD